MPKGFSIRAWARPSRASSPKPFNWNREKPHRSRTGGAFFVGGGGGGTKSSSSSIANSK